MTQRPSRPRPVGRGGRGQGGRAACSTRTYGTAEADHDQGLLANSAGASALQNSSVAGRHAWDMRCTVASSSTGSGPSKATPLHPLPLPGASCPQAAAALQQGTATPILLRQRAGAGAAVRRTSLRTMRSEMMCCESGRVRCGLLQRAGCHNRPPQALTPASLQSGAQRAQRTRPRPPWPASTCPAVAAHTEMTEGTWEGMAYGM